MNTEPQWLERLRTLATALDESLRVPGTDFRVGIDPLLGVLPIAGDLTAAVLSVGMGDAFDIYWKANVRNVELAAADITD